MRNRRLLPENRSESPNASLGLCIRDPRNYQQRTDPDKGNENFVIASEEDLKPMTPQQVRHRKRRLGPTPHAQRQRTDWFRESQNTSLRLSIRDPTLTTLRTPTELHKHQKRWSPTRKHSIHTDECPNPTTSAGTSLPKCLQQLQTTAWKSVSGCLRHHRCKVRATAS